MTINHTILFHAMNDQIDKQMYLYMMQLNAITSNQQVIVDYIYIRICRP